MINTAVILTGGMGNRLKPLTDKIPKSLLPIQGKPVVEHVILNMKKYGVTNVILSIGYRAEQIQKYFKDGSQLGVDITYAIETTPLGTGGAIKQAARGIDKPFILAWGNNLMNLDLASMYKTYLRDAPQVTMALIPRENVENFGVAKLEENKIVQFVEKTTRKEAPSNLINAGTFIIDPECLKMLPEGKSSMRKDCFEKLAPLGEISAHIHEGQWFSTDNLDKYLHADKNFNTNN